MRSFRITSVWGIPIKINVSLLVFLPILAYLIASGPQIETYAGIVETLSGESVDVAVLRAGATPWLIGAVAAVGLFVSVALHELGHSWVALRYDLTVTSITLWLLGGLASFDRLPREPHKEFWIAVAGPITSLAIAAVCYAAVVVVPGSAPTLLFVVGWLAVTNLALAVFNMLPAFPMDGGRVLRAYLARNRPYAAATRTAATVGKLFALLFVFVGIFVLFSPLLLLLALFVYTAAGSESRTVMIADLLAGVTVGDVAILDRPDVSVDASVAQLFDLMLRERQVAFPVVEGGRVVGAVTMTDLERVDPEDRPTTSVADVAVRDLPRIDVDAPAFDALATLAGGAAGIGIVEERGEAVGIVTESDVATALQFRRETDAATTPEDLGRGEPW
jgi:Zn-dependent protease/CBS domain-containing protein